MLLNIKAIGVWNQFQEKNMSTYVRFNEIDFPFLSNPISSLKTSNNVSQPPIMSNIPQPKKLVSITIRSSHKPIYNSFQTSNNINITPTSSPLKPNASLIINVIPESYVLTSSTYTKPYEATNDNYEPTVFSSDKSPEVCTKTYLFGSHVIDSSPIILVPFHLMNKRIHPLP